MMHGGEGATGESERWHLRVHYTQVSNRHKLITPIINQLSQSNYTLPEQPNYVSQVRGGPLRDEVRRQCSLSVCLSIIIKRLRLSCQIFPKSKEETDRVVMNILLG